MKFSLNILRNIALIVTCYIYMLVHGKAKKVPKEINNILVIQTAKMGDMVCSTPVMHALRMEFPNAHITVLGDAIGKQVLDGNNDINNYLVNTTNFFTLLHDIYKAQFDVSIVFVPDSRAIALSFLGGAKFIVAPEIVNGYCPWQTKTYRALRWLVQTMPHRMGHYAPSEYLRLLEPLGIYTKDTTKYLSSSDIARKNASAFLRANNLTEKKFVIISPSAGNKIKNWPSERFARVAEHIVSKGFPVVVIGGPRDTKEVASMMQSLKESRNIIDASEKFSIDELKAIIFNALLFVSVDTGPIYIAEAFEVSTIDIIGPMDEHEQPPISEKHLIVVSKRDKPELHVMNARMYNKTEARRQIESISVDMVIDKVDILLI